MVTMVDDTSGVVSDEPVSDALVQLLECANGWSIDGADRRGEVAPSLSFSSTLAALVAGDDDACRWLRDHLSLRGVATATMTRGRAVRRVALDKPLGTTYSFRQAFAEAKRIRDKSGSELLDVRHLMAAYPVLDNYHSGDFLRLRIDRRAWCLELASHLAARFAGERDAWRNYARRAKAVPVVGLESDAPRGRDLLNIEREVEAFATLLTSRSTLTPLSVGVFGAWGSGKSFFMQSLRTRVAALADAGRRDGRDSPFYGQIAQIEFNAWHYNEGNLAASLVDHIFRNLRFDASEEDRELRERADEVIAKIDTSTKLVAERTQAVAEATTKHAEAAAKIAAIEGQLETRFAAKSKELEDARGKLDTARTQLSGGLTEVSAQIANAVEKVPRRAVANLVIDKLLGDPVLTSARTDIIALANDVRGVAAKRKAFLWGAVVVGAGLLATAIATSSTWATISAGIATLGTLAAAVSSWLKQFDELASRGQAFLVEQRRQADALAVAITAAYQEDLEKLQTSVDARLAAVGALEGELAALRREPEQARLDLAAIAEQRSAAIAEQQQAAAELSARKAELARVGGGLLDEFLDSRVSDEGYRRELTIFARVRNDFERLSVLMSKAVDEYYAKPSSSEPPAVSRIVLYIDDLDRCSSDRIVEVLQMVHLLLAFPLFVCVVAVDPRWASECLVKSFPKRPDDPAAGAAAYLEKIFQIPLWLRPVPSANRPALVRALLDPARDRAPIVIDVPAPEREVDAAAVAAAPKARPGEALSPAQRAAKRQEIAAAELDYLDRLHGILQGNPRSLKRFVNTYRLVKTALFDVDLAIYAGEVRVLGPVDVKYFPYRMCMAQLAVLCTDRARAETLIAVADDPATKTMADLCAKLGGDDDPLVAALHAAFEPNAVFAKVDMSTFSLWLERTRRYSFYL